MDEILKRALAAISQPEKVSLAKPAAYLVSYSLNAADVGFNYLPFLLELQQSPNWWHFLQTTWIVIRNETMVDFTSILLSKLHSRDTLVVLPAKGPPLGWMPKDSWDWLNNNLESEW